jgi:hypothetical protein
MIHILNRFQLHFSTSDNENYRVHLADQDQKVYIPLFLTKKQIEIGIEKLNTMSFEGLSFEFVKMIISGCFVTIMQRQ